MFRGLKLKKGYWCLFCGKRFENIIQIKIERNLKEVHTWICVKCFNNYFKYNNFSGRNLRIEQRIEIRKNVRPYLCSICKLSFTCKTFDYDCVEASDFLFKPKLKVYTVKDDFLDSLTNKSNKALRG